MSLPQEQIVGDVNMLAVSNRLTFLGGQTNHFVAKKGNGGFRFTFWPINCYSGMSAVGVVVDLVVPIFKILLDVLFTHKLELPFSNLFALLTVPIKSLSKS